MDMKYLKVMDVSDLGFKKAIRTNLNENSVRYVFVTHKNGSFTIVFNTENDFETVSEIIFMKDYKTVATIKLSQENHIPEEELKDALRVAARVKNKSELLKIVDKVSAGYWITENMLMLEED